MTTSGVRIACIVVREKRNIQQPLIALCFLKHQVFEAVKPSVGSLS